jgi:hypothetical protein
MKAACPKCFDPEARKNHGCNHCEQTGQIDVGFSDGILFTRACQDAKCGHENGGYIVSPDAKQGPDGEPPEPARTCIECGAPCRWKRLGDMKEVGP